MKKIFFTMAVLFVVILSACTNNSNITDGMTTDEYIHNDTKKTTNPMVESPKVISDFFAGNNKIWFYLDEGELSYNSEIKAVFITNDKVITDLYYNLIDSGYGGSPIHFNGQEPNPCSVERFVLSDFEGLSDEEVVKKIADSYGNIKKEYTLTYNNRSFSQQFTLPSQSFPYKIQYNGELDPTGNKLKSETLSFSEKMLRIDVGTGSVKYYPSIKTNSFNIDSIIKATTIKDKEYVGFKDDDENMIVTVNKYSELNDIDFDMPQ